MTERIKLKAEDIGYDPDHDNLFIDIDGSRNITGEDVYNKIKQQLLDDQEKAKDLELALSGASCNDFTEFTEKMLINLIKAKERDNFKQKLEKMRELIEKESDLDLHPEAEELDINRRIIGILDKFKKILDSQEST